MALRSLPARNMVASNGTSCVNNGSFEDRSEILEFLEQCRLESRQELTIEDLRRGLARDPSNEVIRDFTRLSESEGKSSFTLEECYCVLTTSDILRYNPWLSKILKFTSYMVVSKRDRPAAIARCLDSYTSCRSGSSREKLRSLRKPLLQLPTFILIMSTIQVATFTYYCVNPSCTRITYLCQIPCNSSMIFDPRKRHEAWRYISYSLVHDGFVHLFGNVILQIGFGLPLEIIHGWWRIAVIYLCGLLCGPLSQSFINPNAFIAGSSSGVYSLQTAHLANIVINFKDMEFVLLRLVILLLVYGQDLYRYLYGVRELHGRSVGYVGHYGGAVAGLFVGVPVLKAFHYAPWMKTVECAMFAIFCVFVTSAVLWNVFSPEYFTIVPT
ncbi:rhomboid-related protein 2-like [Ornithodoros turicata]|uniref:rhomboid-related protein 2-like n=1 Tax=Ornithodoros turicata TaxID=34597 RepID=UPI003139D868